MNVKCANGLIGLCACSNILQFFLPGIYLCDLSLIVISANLLIFVLLTLGSKFGIKEMQKIYFKITRSASYQAYKHLGLFAFLFALLAIGFIYFTYSSKMTIASQSFSANGSVTACIDVSPVSSEIEITDVAMKRAFVRLAGFNTPISNEVETPETCSMKLA